MHLSRKWTATLLAGLCVVALGPAGHAEPRDATAASAPAQAPAQAQAPAASPPGIEVLTSQPGTAEGLLFLTPNEYPDMTTPRGPQILDEQGRIVWSRQIEGAWAADFRVQSYRGEPVLTWWEGRTIHQGVGLGTGYIANQNYEIIATVQTPDAGQQIDLHEFRLTPEGTALVISYQEVPHDLTSVGGAADGRVLDAVVQEIDVATGEVLLDWHSLDHIPVTATDHPSAAANAEQAFDYLHLNSVSLDTDGNLLISARHTSTVYKVERASGEIIWRLGGRDSDFDLDRGARFSEQHDAQAEGGGVYRIFDNGSVGGRQDHASRVIWLRLDPRTGTARLDREITHPEQIFAMAEGNAQLLPGGNVLVGWGWANRISEFSPEGELLFDATLDEDVSSYRAYRQEWTGWPTNPPEVTLDDATGELHASWNGATEVAEWRVWSGETRNGPWTAARVPWAGPDTPLTWPATRDTAAGQEQTAATPGAYVQVEALDDQGRVIGTSRRLALS